MTISSETNHISYTGSGGIGPFAVPFYFLEDNDLKVIRRTIADGTEVVMALTTDYTLTGAGVAAGGSLTLVAALSASYQLVIIRDPDVLQSTVYPVADKFPSASHERALDKLTMLMQRVKELVTRSLRLSDGSQSTASLTIPEPAANSFFGWNAAGTALVNYAITFGTTLAEFISGIHAAVSKTTPVDADELPLADSAASFGLKKLTWANLKATLKTYFDGLYAALAGSVSQVFSVGTPTAAAHAVRADYLASRAKGIGNNWNFDIWQMGTSFALTGATYAYTADHWQVGAGAATNLTVSQRTGLNNQRYCMRMQRDSGNTGTGVCFVEQALPTEEIQQLRGKRITVTWRCRVGANWSPAGGALSTYFCAGTGAERTRNTSAFTSETVLSNVNAYPTTSDGELSISTTVDVPANATQMSIYWYWTPVGTAGANDWIEFGQVQIDEGLIKSTPKIYNPAAELAKAQRWTRILGQTGSPAILGPCAISATNGCEMAYVMDPPMRATPTLSVLGTVGNLTISDFTSNLTVTTAALSGGVTNTNSCVLITLFGATSPLVQGRTGRVTTTAAQLLLTARL